MNYSRNRCQGEKSLGVKDVKGMKAKMVPDWLRRFSLFRGIFGWSCKMGVTAQHCRERGERQRVENGY